MTALLDELGKRLAEKWVALLALPGLLFVAVTAVAVTCGQAHAFDVPALLARAGHVAAVLGGHPVIGQVAAVAVVLLVSVVAGTVVRMATPLTQAVWTGRWPRWARPLARRLTARRECRWTAARERVSALREAGDDDGLAHWIEVRNAIALARPARPTWLGDQVAAVESRVANEYGVDLVSAWPRLWLVLSDTERTELRTAAEQFGTKAMQATWAVAYLLLAIVWWPAAIVAVVVGWAAWWDGRTAITAYATLVESVVDLRIRDLAAAAGVTADATEWHDDTGRALARRFRKGS